MSKKEGLLNKAPIPDQWYSLTLGSSFKDHNNPKVCTLRYDFVPASVDKTQQGSLHRKKDKINVEFNHLQSNKPKFNFEGTGDDLKENDAVMYFDGSGFRLERLHRAVKRLKHCRLPGEHASAVNVDPSSPVIGRGGGKGQHSVSNARALGFTPPRAHQAPPPPPPPAPVSVEVEQIDIGEDEHIDIGDDEQIDIGEVERINIGEVEQIDIGEVERIDVGEVERIDVGEVERIDVGDQEMSGRKSQNDRFTNSPAPSEHNAMTSPDSKDFDLEAHLDIMNDNDDDDAFGPDKRGAEENTFTGIDINLPHQNDSDDNIADVDVNGDNGVKARSAAEQLRIHALQQKEKEERTSSSSTSSSKSGSGSGSSSSDSGSSSSDSDSSDGDSLSID